MQQYFDLLYVRAQYAVRIIEFGPRCHNTTNILQNVRVL